MFHQQYKYFKSKHTNTDINDITSKTMKNITCFTLHLLYVK